MCLNSNGQMTNTIFKWTPWMFMCALLLFSKSSAAVEFKYPNERPALVAKDNNNLLNPEFLPFIKDCNSANPPNRMFCAAYFDMVYNVYQYDGNVADVKAEIRQANQTLDKLSEQFCTLFPGEVAQALVKQPFLKANHFNITAMFGKKNYCTANCLTWSDATEQLEIREICKSISGGCKWIYKQKNNIGTDPKISADGTKNVDENPVESNTSGASAFNASLKSNNQSAIITDKQNTTTDAKVDGPIRELKIEDANANTNTAQQLKPNLDTIKTLKLSLNSSSTQNPNPNPNPMPNSNQSSKSILPQTKPSIMPVASEPVQKDSVKSTENRPSTVSENKPNQSKDTFITESRDDTNTNDMINNQNDNNVDDQAYRNDDDPDKQGDETEPEDLAEEARDEERNHEQEVRNDFKNSNNMQSPLLAETADFREDKESSFFPYFMFLMFAIVTMYVAYHNKSKILALLIEGRRSRSYSRGGRRKQHSAEYRKLDSNLEEAIQSDGSHVTSSQIIY